MGMNKFVWLVLLILVSVGNWCCEGCLKEERDALLQLKASFNYTSRLTNWVDGTDCCQWEGVHCNTTTSRVAQLSLYELWWWDQLPDGYRWHPNFSYFEVFEDLKSLDLRDNYIDSCAQNLGSNKRVSKLKNLQVLDLSSNYLNDTNILSCLSGLSSVKSLNLGDNQLTGKSAYGFHKLLLELTDLEELDLSLNYFNHSDLCSYLSGLSSLKVLTSMSSALTSASFRDRDNEKVSWPSNLEILHLAGNYFNNDIVSTFSELHHLKLINLQKNRLEGSLNLSALSALSKLKTLILVNNNITNLSVAEGLSWPTSLEDLQLSQNNVSNDIVSSLRNLQHLRSIDLRYNHLEGSLNISGLNALSKLEYLDLSENSIVHLGVHQGLSWPTSLEDLQLGGNNISNDIVSSFSDLQHLKSLDLSYNHLKGSLDISGLDALSNLETLDLSGNSIVNLGVHQGTKKLSNIKVLYLNDANMDVSILRESLQSFSSITRLTLLYSKFNGSIIAQDFGDLDKLEVLNLGYSFNIKTEFFKSIGALTSLKFLSMHDCGINGTLADADWSKLIKLEELDLSSNEFMGPLPSSFGNMTSLRKLELFDNHFTGNIASTLVSLTSLEYLDFEENQFEVPASFTSLANHSYIKFIYGSGNKLIPDPDSTTQPWIPKFQLQDFLLSSITKSPSLSLPNFLFYQYNLTSVDFTNWKFDGEFRSWLLENNTKMTDLTLRNCSITGHLQLSSHSNIVYIDVSDNSITSITISKNSSSFFPNLGYFIMSKNKIIGSFPDELSQLKFLDILDVSNNHFSGSIPSSIFDTSISILDISNNNFCGKLPKGIANSSYLWELHMDNNHFEGSIPTEFVEHKSLYHLDLSGNNLSGLIPSLVNTSIEFIYLSNNRLSGFSARMFNENSSLILLDLSYNKITSSLQALGGNYTKLNILLLKGNNFIGPIPKQLCRLTNLTIVDLSYNILSGLIPKCLGELNFKVGDLGLDLHVGLALANNRRYEMKEAEANFSTKGRSYTYRAGILSYMTGMDLSHNKLDGNIPSELGNLTEIRAINLSHNCLTGEIPATFSNLKQIESLDLSFNKLSGTIPPQLNELNSLEVFSVAYNNISGTIPERKAQFITFDESSYEGNPFLCGPPLNKSCTPFASIPNALNGEGDNDGFLDMQAFYASFAVAYSMVLLVMVVVLYINPYWRQAWFYFIEFVITSCYYFFVDFFYKLSTIRNM